MVTGIKALDPGVTRDNRGKIKDSVTFNLRAPFFHWSWSSQHLFSSVRKIKPFTFRHHNLIFVMEGDTVSEGSSAQSRGRPRIRYTVSCLTLLFSQLKLLQKFTKS